MPGFNLGFNQRNFNGTKATSTAAVNMGAMRGKASTSRMLNFCKTHSTNPSGCINQFVNIAPPPPPPPPPPPTPTILVYSASQGPSFVWSGVTFTLDTSLPQFSYTAITSSIPATQLPQARTVLTGVTIGNSVTSIGNNAFQSCTNLASVIIGNSVTSIGISAFQACTILASTVTIPASVTSIGISAFQGCFGLTSINVDTSNTSYSSIDGVLFNKAGTTLVEFPPGKSTSYIIPNLVTSIGTNAFIDVNGLTSVTIPDSVTTIGTNAFQSCNFLSTVSITVNSALTSIGDQAFRTCPDLTSILIPPLVTSIGISAFQGCSKFTSIVIPALVTTIGANAFTSCTLLTTVYIGQTPQTISGTPYSAPSTVNFFGKTVNIVYPPP